MADNLARIKETIGSCPVKLIAVTKNVGPQQIAEAFDLGVTEFGENRVQDALEKQRQLAGSAAGSARWHLIGHLQTNKVRQVVGRFALIHSVDSLRLARQISKQAEEQDTVQAILLQVKVLEDPSKSGFTPEELRLVFPELLQLPGVSIKGLMTITPLTDSQQVQRKCFEGLRQLRDELKGTYDVDLEELSMGMSQDYPQAIKCGATMVRLGRAVFNA